MLVTRFLALQLAIILLKLDVQHRFPDQHGFWLVTYAPRTRALGGKAEELQSIANFFSRPI